MHCGLTYTDSRRVEHVARDMQALARHGATYVVHMLHEQDLRAYSGTMREIVRASREAGLGVWLDPVGLGYVFGGDDFLSDFALRHPEAAQVDGAGRPLPAACPNQSVFRAFARDWVDRAVDLGPDALFWDEPHLVLGDWIGEPERWGCRCGLCQALYREQFGGEMPADGADPGVLAFQSDTLLSLLRELLAYARGQGARSAVTLLPHEQQRPGALDWEAVAGLPGLHSLGTDPYPFPAYPNQPSHGARWRPLVQEYAERVVDLCARRALESHLWVQGFSVPAADNGYLDEVWEVAAAAGIANVAVWGFEGSRDMSQFACEDPRGAWDKIGRGLRRLRGTEPRAA
jgi:hypothetical protein